MDDLRTKLLGINYANRNFIQDVWYETTSFIVECLFWLLNAIIKIIIYGIPIVIACGLLYLLILIAINGPFFFALGFLFFTLWIIYCKH